MSGVGFQACIPNKYPLYKIYTVYMGLSIQGPPSQHHFPYDAKGQQWVENGCIIVCPNQKETDMLGPMFFVHKMPGG